MPEEIFVAQLLVGSRGEGRTRQAELEAQAAPRPGAVQRAARWLGLLEQRP